MDSQDQPELEADALAEALDRMWVRFLPQILERVTTLEMATAAAVAGTITQSERADAHAAAPKLAGTLGMFDLMRGTVLAREMETAFSLQVGPDRESGQYLASIAAKLRTMIEGRPSKTPRNI
jgi:hypothetical protein